MINQRIFSANVGDISTGQAGPDAIEQDIDNLFANDQELLETIGNKANLTTTNKTNLVAAINEHETKIVNLNTTIESQTIAENYLSAHNIPSTAKRGKLDVKLRGQSVVNLLGADGNCETLGKWGDSNSSHTLDSTNKVFGTNGYKITIVANGTAKLFKFNAVKDITKHYMFSAYVKNGNATNIYVGKDNNNGGIAVNSEAVTTTSFKRVAVKLKPSDLAVNNYYLIAINGSASQYAYVDGIMINEITADDYNNLTVDELMAKYPYHDGLQGATPTVKSCGKNLINLPSNFVFTTPYEGNKGYRICTFPVKPNTAYRLSGSYIKSTGTNGQGGFDVVGSQAIPSDTLGWFVTNFDKSLTSLMRTENASANFINTFNSADNRYISIYLGTNVVVTTFTLTNLQIEEGTTTTPYEPYKGTEVSYKTLDGQPITLHKLPNGVYDEITDDGKLIKRIGEKILISSDVTLMLTAPANVDVARIPTSLINGIKDPLVDDLIATKIVTSYGISLNGNGLDDINSIGKHYVAGSGYLSIIMAKGTTLAQAQTALTGTKLIYQFAQPQILDTNATPLIAEPNGNVFITSEGTQPSVELSYPINLGAVVDGLIEGQKGLGQFIEGGLNSLEAKKLDKTKQGWIALSPQSGWTGTLYYRKNQAELIEIQGNITAGTRTAGTVIAVLPEGYRPSQYSPIESYISSLSKVVNGLVLANDSGELRIYAPATTDIGSGNTISICKVLP